MYLGSRNVNRNHKYGNEKQKLLLYLGGLKCFDKIFIFAKECFTICNKTVNISDYVDICSKVITQVLLEICLMNSFENKQKHYI